MHVRSYPGDFSLDMPRIGNIHKLLDPEIRKKNVLHARYYLRGLYWNIMRPESTDPIFVVGCSRSGTTVTYETIASAPGLLSFGFELPQFWNGLWGPAFNDWDSESASSKDTRPGHRDNALSFFYQRLGRGQVLDKTCINVMRVPYLHALFPKAKFIYIHRDGRSNISSMMDGWRDGRFELTQFLGKFPEAVNIEDGKFKEWHFFLPPSWRDYNNASLEEACAYQWKISNRMALDAKNNIPDDQWIQLKYEDIFERPVEMFREAFDKIGIQYTDELQEICRSLHRRPTSIVQGAPSLEKWRKQNPDAIERISMSIKPIMQELGYEC